MEKRYFANSLSRIKARFYRSDEAILKANDAGDGRKRGTLWIGSIRVYVRPLGQETDPGRETQKRRREPRGFDGLIYRSRTPPRRADFSPWHEGQRTGYTVDLGDIAAPGASRNVRSQPVAARCPLDARMRLEARSYSIVKTG